ncbi:MAG: isochorismatase family protein [Corynebacterium sp.]|nr:isochorismatase family protein [Corynebacterium sp.]
MSSHALIIVDVQPDFCPGGPLGTTAGDQVAARIAEYVSTQNYDLVVTTQDWHIDPGSHFSEHPDFQNSWPVHCKADTPGAALHPEIAGLNFDAHFLKGEYEAAYSGFEGHLAADDSQDLASWLRTHDVDHVDIVGIATDFCVKATALDAAAAGFHTRVLPTFCAPVHAAAVDEVLTELEGAGVHISLT